jgi:pyruvate dehydrogenase E2 component (dihydrolipoamide acetyltransferase)
MPTDVIMPQMGESIFEGTITKWLKQTGERVEKDEPLFEISTDKVDAEIPSPVAGIVAEIRFPEGATVQVNAVVAVLEENGALPSRPRKQQESATQAAPKAQPRPPKGTRGIDIVMPQLGESIFEGTITRWLKKPGEQVRKDEPLFEISTDKVDAEIPSPSDGVLVEIKFAEGATVEVNSVVAVLASETVGSTLQVESLPRAVAPKSQPTSPPTSPPPAPGAPRRSSPLVRRIAREHRIDLALVSGTGTNGRITKDDILSFVAERPHPAAGASRAVKASLAEVPTGEVPATPPMPLQDELVPMTRMRALIAERMAESKRTIPHAHTVYKVDMTRIVRLRARHRDAFEQSHGFKLTYMPFIAAAAIDALRQFPILNASLVEGGIQYHGNIHLGIAVALEWGLIVPVIRSSEQRNFLALARAIHDLAQRARAKKLMPEEVGGSTFTLTNPGVFGGEYGLPIINQPESAILAIGGLRKEPVVLTDEEDNDTIAIRSVQYFCLGFDHRLIDGADSGKFMTAFKTGLEDWDRPIA